MRNREVAVGRTVVVVFDHGDDFSTALVDACRMHGIRQGYVPMFIAGFSSVDLVGTCQRLEDPRAPVWSAVQLSNVEAVGAGTLAWDDTTSAVAAHMHVAVGLKEHSATGHTSHLLAATVQFLTELVIVEVLEPLARVRQPDLYDVPLLRFGTDA